MSGKFKIYYSGGQILDVLKDSWRIGASPALSQLSFAPRMAVTNALAFSLGGTAGIIAFSLCTQMLSVVSIFLGSVIGALLPIAAVLHGQKDYRGEADVLSAAQKLQFVMNILCVAGIEIFAEGFAGMYNVTDAHELAVSAQALRIFAVMFIFRGFYIVVMKYWQASGKNLASFTVSMLDGFAGIIPVMYIMSLVIGLQGIWWGYVLTSMLIFAGTVMHFRKSGLFREARENDSSVLYSTIVLDDASISGASEKLEELCRNAGLEKSVAIRSALAIEEMSVYTRNHMKNDNYMDITARFYADRTEIDFRTLGEPFDPMSTAQEDMPENMNFLRAVSSSIKHDFIMGMNCTTIIIANKKIVIAEYISTGKNYIERHIEQRL